MTMTPRRPVPRLLAALITATLTCAASAQQDVRLPDLGSSANALISPQEAQDYGDAMLRQMRALDILQFKLDVLWQMNDAMAQHYGVQS